MPLQGAGHGRSASRDHMVTCVEVPSSTRSGCCLLLTASAGKWQKMVISGNISKHDP